MTEYLKGNFFGLLKNKFGKERFIALKAATNNNYASKNFTRPAPKENQDKVDTTPNNTEKALGTNTNPTT